VLEAAWIFKCQVLDLIFKGEIMLLFKKEKEVIELILKHVDMVEECLQTGIKTIESYLQEEINEAKAMARKAQDLESEADIVRYKIRDNCCDFFLNQRPLIPDEMKPQFLAVSRESLGIIDYLKLAVLCYFKGECKIETVREHTKEVGIQESSVDKDEWDLTKEIFTSSLDFSQKIHLKHCLNSIVEASDRAEDAADQLELATLKSMV
jgi:uncharacterized protein Yka (UPF0111/DUF47 family)